MKSISVTPVLPGWTWKANDTNYFRLRITFDRKSRFIKTTVLVHRDQIAKSGKVKEASIRHDLDDLVRRVETAAAQIDSYALSRMTVDDVVRFIERTYTGDFRLDFFAFASEVIAKKKPSSRGGYTSAVNALKEFVGGDTMDISQMTSSMLRRYQQWLEEKYGERARAVSAYTAALRYLHARAREQYNNEETGYVPIRNPFQYYRPPQQRAAAHRAVEAQLIQDMIDLRPMLKGRERLGVDVFLISFALMGMNAPDLFTCAPAKGGVITYNRTKTAGRRADHALMKVRLEPEVLPLIEGYLAKSRTRAFDFDRRYTTYQILGENVNDGLRAFCKRVGHPPITLYSARHSWATIAYRCVDRGVINDCLCHVDRGMKVTDIYIEKDWSVMWDANRKVLEQFRW